MRLGHGLVGDLAVHNVDAAQQSRQALASFGQTRIGEHATSEGDSYSHADTNTNPNPNRNADAQADGASCRIDAGAGSAHQGTARRGQHLWGAG